MSGLRDLPQDLFLLPIPLSNQLVGLPFHQMAMLQFLVFPQLIPTLDLQVILTAEGYLDLELPRLTATLGSSPLLEARAILNSSDYILMTQIGMNIVF